MRRHSVSSAALFGVVLAGVLALAGCGGGSTGSGLAGVPSSGAAEPTASGVAGAERGVSTIATAGVHEVQVFASSGGSSPVRTIVNPNENGVVRVFLVVGSSPGWWKVLLPVQPNGTTGWIRASDVTTRSTTFAVRVAVSDHRIRLFDRSRIVLDEPIAVGTSDTPTPGGHYYITELLRPPNPDGPYGPYAYGISGYSTTLASFAGQAPVIGIHGTNQPQLLGKDVSHGCIRLSNAAITRLAGLLPLGAPVYIDP